MHMFSVAEKEMMLAQRHILSKYLMEQSSVRGDLFACALYNFLKKSVPSDRLRELDFHHLNDPSAAEAFWADALKLIVTIATEEVEYGKTYTTGELAKLFGVSITTIHNWFHEGRFKGVEKKERHKQLKFSASALWQAPDGTWHTIQEIADRYAQPERPVASLQEEQSELAEAISFFENKYGCTLEDFLNHPQLDADSDLKRDAQEWAYLVRRRGECCE